MIEVGRIGVRSGDGTAKAGASNDQAMRLVAAKVAALSEGSDPRAVRPPQTFSRHAAQDCEGDEGAPVKKDLHDAKAPYVEKKNYHGPGSDVEKANELTLEALKKVQEVKQKVLGEQFAKIEGVDHLQE